MKPTHFPEQTHVLNQGLLNETPICVDGSIGTVTICYEATPEELAEINANGGKVYVTFAILFPNMPIPINNVSPEMYDLAESAKAKRAFEEKVKHVAEGRDKRNPNRLFKK